MGELPLHLMAFSIKNHAGEGVERFRIEEIEKKTQKEMEKEKSKVEALENCDRGSLPSSFLLLVLCSAR